MRKSKKGQSHFRYKIVNHQINQLKEEIEAKEVALAKEHFELKKKQKTHEEKKRNQNKKQKDIEIVEEQTKSSVLNKSKDH